MKNNPTISVAASEGGGRFLAWHGVHRLESASRWTLVQRPHCNSSLGMGFIARNQPPAGHPRGGRFLALHPGGAALMFRSAPRKTATVQIGRQPGDRRGGC